MNFATKEWQDRISEYPTRRTLTKEDGTTELVTVARSEGTISSEGDAFSAENMNDLEQRVGDAFEKVPESTSVKAIELVQELPATGTEGTVYFTYEG